MIVQNGIFEADTCNEKELFFRNEGNVDLTNERLILSKCSKISLDTYFNLFDIQFWEKHTGITQWIITFCAKGNGKMVCCDKEKICSEITIDTSEETSFEMEIDSEKCCGYVFLKAEALDKLEILKIAFLPRNNKKPKDISLSVIICTYKRNQELFRNLSVIKSSRFFDQDDELNGKMNVHVVDNASEIKMQDENDIYLYHNPNTGGSGGFSRGMDECCKTEDRYKTSHVVLMDDDVEFVAESFYRLYALLSYLKPEYQERPVAGRMFRTDTRQIQYTAVEIWNKGDLKHIGFMQDMTRPDNLLNINDSENAEYGGWWFCCYPMEFVRDNRPLPFFLHCDDVEYGLRCGKTPIILNGIQVWHETYEKRQTPVMVYYDYRNTLFVNQIYGLYSDPSVIFSKWKDDIVKLHADEDYINEYIILLAYCDYKKGMTWLKKNGNKQKKYIEKKEWKIKLEIYFIKRYIFIMQNIKKRI